MNFSKIVIIETLHVFRISIGNKVVRMGDTDTAAAPGAEGATSGDVTIVRGQQFLVAPR